MTDNNFSTPEELDALNRLRQFNARTLRTDQINQHNSRVKEDVSPQEYVTRLERSLKRDNALVVKEKSRRIAKATEEWKSKVGKTFAEATTEDPRILDRVNRLVTHEGNHKTSLCFYGELGVGKTWHSHAFINLAIAAGAVTPGQVWFGSETDVLGRISSSGFRRSELLEELLHPRYKIYFIDEVGLGYFSNEQSRTELWGNLIDHIYTHQLSLVITTNKTLTPNSLGGWIGSRAFDRLKVIVGEDGAIVPGRINRRAAVLEEQEAKLRSRSTKK